MDLKQRLLNRVHLLGEDPHLVRNIHFTTRVFKDEPLLLKYWYYNYFKAIGKKLTQI